MGSEPLRSGLKAMAALIVLTAAHALADDKLKGSQSQPNTEKQPPGRRIVVSIPDRKLALMEGDRVVRVWRTAVGTRSTPTPSGTFVIVNRVLNPTYYRPGKVVEPGPSNPVGTRWLGLSLKGFGIHGTNNPGSIGRKASHGCIRMLNRDIEELFELVRVGDVVELHTRRDMDSERSAVFSGKAPEKILDPTPTASGQ